MIAKDGWPIIRITGVAFCIFLIISIIYVNVILITVTCLIGFLVLFHLFFFRDPERKIPQNQYAILSPADGRVVSIEKVEEKEYFKENVWKISIFLSVFNVHVNRMPVSGKIEYLKYKKGQFLAAFAGRASELNEQSVIWIQNIKGKVSRVTPPFMRVAPRNMLKNTIIHAKTAAKVRG